MIEKRPVDRSSVIDQEIGYAIQDANIAPEGQSEQQVAMVGKLGSMFRELFPKKYVPDEKAADVISRYNERKGQPRGLPPEDLDLILQEVDQLDGPPLTPGPEGPTPAPTTVAPEEAGTMMPGEIFPQPGATTDELLQEFQQTPSPDPYSEMRTDQRNINIQRHHPGAEASEALINMPADEALEQMQTADDIAKLLDASAKAQNLQKETRSWAEVEGRTDTPAKIREELSTVFKGDPNKIGALTDVQLYGLRRMLTSLGQETAELAKRITDGDTSTETLLLYEKKGRAFMSLQAFTQGKVSEAARALAQQRMIAKTIDSQDIAHMSEFMQSGLGEARSPEDIVRMASVQVKSAAERGTDAAAANMWKPDKNIVFKSVVEYWTNNILSGVETHAVNMIGIPAVKMYEDLVIRPIAGIVGSVKRLRDPNYKGVQVGQESMARLIASTVGISDSLTAFTKALMTGDSAFGASKGAENKGAMHQLFGYYGEQMGSRKAGEAVATAGSLSYRALGAEDAFWKMNIFRSEYTALLVRDAYTKGIDVSKHIQDGFANPENFEDVYNQAMDLAKKYTFTESDRPGLLGDLSRSAKSFLSKHPALKFILPFVETPSNLIHYAVENSALAPLTTDIRNQWAKGGADADIATARVIAGTGMTISAWQLAEVGVLAGTGPDKREAADIMEKIGVGQNAIYIAGEYYVVDRMDPFAMSMFAVVNAIEEARYAREDRTLGEGFAKGILNVANHALDATWMKGANDLIQAIQGGKDVKSYIANFVPGFIPYSSFIKSIEKIQDPQVQVYSKDTGFETDIPAIILQKIQMGIPSESGSLRPARYWDGELKHPRGGKPASMMTLADRAIAATWPIYTYGKVDKTDKASEELYANGVYPSEPAPVVNMGGVSFSLLSLDNGDGILYDQFIRRVGEYRREFVSTLINDQNYINQDAGPNSLRASQLQNALAKATKAGLGKFIEEDLPAYLKANPEEANTMSQLIGMDITQFLERAIKDALPEDVQGKVKVRGKSDVGQLPLPKGLQPEF
jgi:hypothetical protein